MPIEPEIEDVNYLQYRALQEREAAATCESNAVAMIHLKLADAYQQRLANEIEKQMAAIQSVDSNVG